MQHLLSIIVFPIRHHSFILKIFNFSIALAPVALLIFCLLSHCPWFKGLRYYNWNLTMVYLSLQDELRYYNVSSKMLQFLKNLSFQWSSIYLFVYLIIRFRLPRVLNKLVSVSTNLVNLLPFNMNHFTHKICNIFAFALTISIIMLDLSPPLFRFNTYLY